MYADHERSDRRDRRHGFDGLGRVVESDGRARRDIDGERAVANAKRAMAAGSSPCGITVYAVADVDALSEQPRRSSVVESDETCKS